MFRNQTKYTFKPVVLLQTEQIRQIYQHKNLSRRNVKSEQKIGMNNSAAWTRTDGQFHQSLIKFQMHFGIQLFSYILQLKRIFTEVIDFNVILKTSQINK